MPEHPTDAHFLFTFVFKQALSFLRLSHNGGSNPGPFRYE